MSILKTAMITQYDDGKIDIDYFPGRGTYQDLAKLKAAGVDVHTGWHTPYWKDDDMINRLKAARGLAKCVSDTIKAKIASINLPEDEEFIVTILNEGFAYGATGNAFTDMTGYKFILLNKLWEDGYRRFRFVAPMSAKAVVNCAKRGMTKIDVINAVKELGVHHKFFRTLKETPVHLKRVSRYVDGVDDICDALCVLLAGGGCLFHTKEYRQNKPDAE